MANGFSTSIYRTGLGRVVDPKIGRAFTPTRQPAEARLGAQETRSVRETWLTSILDENRNSQIYLTDSLAGDVFLQVAMNLDPRFAEVVPQILCVTGPFGCGKTTGVDEALRRIHCEPVTIEASELESPLAGVPAKLIRERYLKASQDQSDTNRPHALVIHDIHLALAVGPMITATINLQMVVAALTGICDHPLRTPDGLTERIPIITTANDLSGVYGALLRSGRMRAVTLELSSADRTRIAAHILRGLLTPEQIARNVARHPEWPIAAFRQLKAILARRSFNRLHSGKTAAQVLSDLMSSRAGSLPISAHDDTVTQAELDEAVATVNEEALAKRDFTGSEAPTGFGSQ